MRQGRKITACGVALALIAAAAVPMAASWATAAPNPGRAEPGSKARNAMHQFTGNVTAVDQGTLTVEKRGKKPRTVVFAKHAEMKTTGDVVKNARVTVYYRDEGGRAVAHRVIVKADKPRSPSRG